MATSPATRALTDADHPAVAKLAAAAFPATQSRFVRPGPDGGLVMTIDGQLVAAALLRVIQLPSGRRCGFIAWLMTDPAVRGDGLAGRLVTEATALLRKRGCDSVATDVEGYNSASAKVFFNAGYQRQSLWRQLQHWNPLDLFWLWSRSGHAIDPGHFLWVSEAVADPVSGSRARLSAILLTTLIALLALTLGGGIFLPGDIGLPSLVTALGCLIGVCGLISVRELGMQCAAARHRQTLVYRAWSGGAGMAALIAIGFGATLPLPGNVYPPGDGWRIRDHQIMLAEGAAVAALLMIGMVMLGSWLRDADGDSFAGAIGLSMVFVGKPLLIFDTLVAIAPFEGFNSRHLRDGNRLAWLGLSALAIVVFVWV